MALLFCDGFDHYATADLGKKWNYSYSSSNAITATNKRTGTSCFYAKRVAGAGAFGYLRKDLLVNFQTLVQGMYFYRVGNSKPAGLWIYDGATVQASCQIATDGFIKLYKGTTLVATSIRSWAVSSGYYMEFKASFDGANGVLEAKINGEVWVTYSGDTTQTANDYGNIIRIGGDGSSDNDDGIYIDDYYLDDADYLGDVKVETIYPSAAGDATAWTPSAGDNYAAVDEAAPDSDTTYVSSATVDQIDTYTMGDLVTTAGVVKGVQALAYARKDDAGSRNIALVARPASTDRVGDTKALSDDYNYSIQVWDVNPEDDAAWEIADINGAKFGVKLVS